MDNGNSLCEAPTIISSITCATEEAEKRRKAKMTTQKHSHQEPFTTEEIAPWVLGAPAGITIMADYTDNPSTPQASIMTDVLAFSRKC